MKRKSLLFLLLFALIAPWAANAQETLTVYEDGTNKNSYVPFYGLYADTQGAASECVIPSDQLEEMTGGQITEMKFYIGTVASAAWTGTHQVYLGEVDATTLTGITGPSAFTVVKTASFDATGTELTVVFDEPYTYGGGNLLIGTYVSVAGNWKSAYFYGVNQTENTGWYRNSGSASGSGVKFLPKTTFTYTPSGNYCPKPTNVAVSDVEPFGATVSWDGSASNYNIRYRAARGFNYGFESAEGFVVDQFPPCTTYDGDGLPTYGVSGYTMPNNTANYVGSVVSFNEHWDAHSGNVMGVFMDAIPSDEGGPTANDDYFITPALTIANGDHFIFWARSITDSYGLERMKVGIYGGNGTISTYLAGSANTYVEVPVAWTEYNYDLTAYVGQTIQLAINCVSADAFALLFDDLFVGNPTDDTWDQTLFNVTSPYVLTGLSAETIYDVQVQAVCGGEDGSSDWTNTVSFTTPSNCAKPQDLVSSHITTNSATLEWAGYQESYVLRYRTAASRETYYFNDFNDQSIEGWTYDGYWIYGFTDPIYNVAGDDNYFLAMGWEGNAGEEIIISNELPAYGSNAYVEFYYFGYNTANTFQIGYSTTTNDASAFTWSDPIDAPLGTYTLYQRALADGVKYVAWKATGIDEDEDGGIFIDDFGVFGADILAGEWNTVTVTTTTYNATNLADNTLYEWEVRGVNSSCDGGYTDWNNATFTTLDACQAPTNLIEEPEVTATTATLSWEGIATSYDLRYRTARDADVYFYEDFSEGIGDWTMVDCHEQSGLDEEYGIFEFHYTTTPPQYLISPELTLPADVTCTLQFLYAAGMSYYPESFKVGYSSTGNSVNDFTWGEEITADNEEELTYYIEDMPAGTKYFAIQCTSDDAYYLYVLDFMIHGPITPAGEWQYVYDVANPYTLTGLNPTTAYDWQVSNEGCDKWSLTTGYFVTEVQTNVTQTIALAAGTNWFSTNVEITLDQLKAALVAGSNTSGMVIQAQDGAITTYLGNNRWRGNLSTLDVAYMYKIKVSADCEISLTGMPINPAEHSITIPANQVVWIGFPLAESMTPANAFDGFAVPGDVVSYIGSTTSYLGNNRWRGSLTNLEPGKGYIYTSKATTQRTLIYPTTSKAAKNAASRLSIGMKNEHPSFSMPRNLDKKKDAQAESKTMKKAIRPILKKK